MENLTIVYRNASVMAYLHDRVDEVAHVITNTDKLETRIYSQLAAYYSRGNQSYRRAQRLINREIKLAINQYRKQNVVMFSGMTKNNDFGESLEFEPEDTLARVSETAIQNISLNEKIARLATDDRELVTLNAWSNGFSDTQVSETLASQFGGNHESHRKFVQRFRVKCQRKLGA